MGSTIKHRFLSAADHFFLILIHGMKYQTVSEQQNSNFVMWVYWCKKKSKMYSQGNTEEGSSGSKINRIRLKYVPSTDAL